MSVRLTSHAVFVDAVDRASSIALASYTLNPKASVTRALERAGDRGSAVSVVLEGDPYGPAAGIAATNRATARDLRAHGVRVRFAGPRDERVHLKAALVDGTAYLDDRNWPDRGGETIVATGDPAEIGAVRSALAGKPSAAGDLATGKAGALALEAGTIAASRGSPLEIESESFGRGIISKAVAARVTAGDEVRLLVSEAALRRAEPGERAALDRLAAAGVAVRVGASEQKFCVSGTLAWLGSANASYAPPGMLDWGARTREPTTLARLAATFARDWERASPLAP